MIAGGEGPIPTIRLFIINTYKNLSGINLDKSNIKSKPVKIFYIFEDIEIRKYNINDLNNFVGVSGDNPLFFNIEKYMKKIQILIHPLRIIQVNMLNSQITFSHII